MLAGSDGTRKSLCPAFAAGDGAQNGNVPVAAHVVPVYVEHSTGMQEAESGSAVRKTETVYNRRAPSSGVSIPLFGKQIR